MLFNIECNIVQSMVGDIDTYRANIFDMESEEKRLFESISKSEVVYGAVAYLDESDSDSFRFTLSGKPFHSEEYIDILNFDHEYPITKSKLIRILITYIRISDVPNNMLFDTVVTRCGNSLVVKITDQCRFMALEPGDFIRVKIERINTKDSSEDISRIFDRKQTSDLNPYVMYADEEFIDHYDRFIRDYHIIGMISIADVGFDPMDRVMDHQSAVKTEDGNVILISIPYNAEGREEYSKAFAEAHNLDYDFINQYSWYHRGDTQLIIFWKKGVQLRISH